MIQISAVPVDLYQIAVDARTLSLSDFDFS